MPHYRWLILILVLVLILPACAKKETVPVEETPEPIEEVSPPAPPPLEEIEEEPGEVEEMKPLVLEDVFFDLDKFNIKEEYKSILAENADCIIEHSDAIILVEGHCDERGTNEYNISLGEKRARAVLNFYKAYGVSAERLSMVSYGEERPFDKGHGEEAWAKNRRAHMVIK